MRIASLALVLLLSMPVCAQETPVPDTTEAWRYFPMEVGNTWEYWRHHPVGDMAYERSVIPKDTVIAGTRYFIRESYEAAYTDRVEPWEFRGRSIVRFDTLLARLVIYIDGTVYTGGCRYDVAFGAIVVCEGSEERFQVGGGYRSSFAIGGDTAPAYAEKWFELIDIPWDGPTCLQVAGIGFGGCEGFWSPGIEAYDLRYLRLVQDGQVYEYGSPVPVANEPDLVLTTEQALTAYPNPFTEAVTLQLALSVPQRVTLAIYDVLGRQVYSDERVASGTEAIHVEAAGWPSGLYLVRLGSAEGQVTTVPVVKR